MPSDQNQEPPQSYLPPIPTPPPPPDEFMIGPPDRFTPGEKQKRRPGRSLQWSEVFQMALTQPNGDAYEEILSDPQVSTNRAYVWIIACATVAAVIQLAGQLFWGNSLLTRSSSDFSPLCSIVCLPFVGALSLIVFLIGTGIQHLAARVLGGQGSFDDLVYANAAWTAPMSILSAVISLVPCINCFGSLLYLYGLVLSVIAVKTVHRFEMGRAILAVFWWIPLLCLCAVALLCLVGPAVGNIMQNILTEIATPQP